MPTSPSHLVNDGTVEKLIHEKISRVSMPFRLEILFYIRHRSYIPAQTIHPEVRCTSNSTVRNAEIDGVARRLVSFLVQDVQRIPVDDPHLSTFVVEGDVDPKCGSRSLFRRDLSADRSFEQRVEACA